MGILLVAVLMFAMSDAMLYAVAIYAIVCLWLSFKETAQLKEGNVNDKN